MTVLLVFTGTSLLLLLALDVFLTVFHARGTGGPLTYRHNRGMWGLFRKIGATAGGQPREHLLALAAPAMVVATLVTWTVLLVGGFTLIYYPWILEFLVSPGSLRTGWLEAVYYSGYTAATLGFGDVVPDSELLRLLAPLEAFAGFALLPAATTYLLSTYRELIVKRALAANIAGYFGSAQIHTPQFVRTGGYEAMARWSEGITADLLHVLHAHFQYPILHYFRRPDASTALPVQLGHLLELRNAATADDPEKGISVLGQHPSYLALWGAVLPPQRLRSRKLLEVFETGITATAGCATRLGRFWRSLIWDSSERRRCSLAGCCTPRVSPARRCSRCTASLASPTSRNASWIISPASGTRARCVSAMRPKTSSNSRCTAS